MACLGQRQKLEMRLTDRGNRRQALGRLLAAGLSRVACSKRLVETLPIVLRYIY